MLDFFKMARATATIRLLKNQDTGIDLSVTSVKEVKALIGSAFEYEITVVSNLGCFKNAKHKESDNVQFTTFKKFSDFEEIHMKLNSKYTGTVFPQLPKKVIKVSTQVAKERRAELDHFLKFLAMTDKLSCCPLLLEFLGVNSVKANNFRKPESSVPVAEENSERNGKTSEADVREDSKNRSRRSKDVKKWSKVGFTPLGDLFEDGNIDGNVNDDDDIFSDPNQNIGTHDETKIFDDQDFGGALTEDDDSDLFVPEARTHIRGQGQTSSQTVQEDNEDLLRIEDDLEDLVKLGTKPSNRESNEKAEQREHYSNPSVDRKPILQANNPNTVLGDFKSGELNDNEKALKQKPNLPQRPKPVLPKKPGESAEVNRRELKQKPVLAPRPDLKPKPVSNSVITGNDGKRISNEIEVETSVANLNEDDILKYIQDNNANNDDDLDLFS